MAHMIKNKLDGRIVCQHKKFERYYVQDPYLIDERLKVFTTDDIHLAYDVLEATKEFNIGKS